MLLGSGVYNAYTIKMSKTVFLEDDDTKHCADYPLRSFDNYSQCDDQFITENIPPGLVPLWAVNEMENVTKSMYVPYTPKQYGDLFDGALASDCPLPCTTISIESYRISSQRTNDSMIEIYFNQRIKVTSSTFITFTLSGFLSAVGGGLGLWLGLGIAQSFYQSTEVVECLVNRCRNVKQHK